MVILTKAINREVAKELVGGEEGREEWRPERVETTPSVKPMQMGVGCREGDNRGVPKKAQS